MNNIMKSRTETRKAIEERKARSAWDKGVKEYALELLDSIERYDDIYNREDLRKIILNGARDWNEYSWGGCSLIYDCEIAERLCTPSELKRKDDGRLAPNSREEWLDTQARALYQAAHLLERTMFS